jgi:hypothetical protein
MTLCTLLLTWVLGCCFVRYGSMGCVRVAQVWVCGPRQVQALLLTWHQHAALHPHHPGDCDPLLPSGPGEECYVLCCTCLGCLRANSVRL